MKVLFTYNYGEKEMKAMEDLGYELLYCNEKNIEYIDEYEDVEVLVCYDPFKTLDINKMKKLKYIQLSSTGIDQVPLDINESIIISNNHGGYSIPMGEWVVLKILEIYKDSRYFYDIQKKKEWKMNTDLLEIKDKVVGFIGTGTVAQESAKRLSGFEAEIIGFNRSGNTNKYFDKVYKIEDIDKYIKDIDVVVIALPSTNDTYHLINENYLEMMKNNSILINVSRGKVLDEKALIEKHDKFLGIALDVFEVEPLAKENPLWELDNVFLSPHNSWISDMRNKRRYDLIYENLNDYIKGNKIKNIVNIKRGY